MNSPVNTRYPEDVMTLPQGNLRLLESDVAGRLLASTETARLAYVASDGTPRLVPMMFHWNGTEIVVSTFAGAHKIAALRAKPDVAITIDTAAMPPLILQIRGRASVTDVDGIVPEYALAWRRYAGDEQAAATLAEIDHPDVKMARIAVRPTWVGVVDFMTRFPGGTSAEEFQRRGRS